MTKRIGFTDPLIIASLDVPVKFGKPVLHLAVAAAASASFSALYSSM